MRILDSRVRALLLVGVLSLMTLCSCGADVNGDVSETAEPALDSSIGETGIDGSVSDDIADEYKPLVQPNGVSVDEDGFIYESSVTVDDFSLQDAVRGTYTYSFLDGINLNGDGTLVCTETDADGVRNVTQRLQSGAKMAIVREYATAVENKRVRQGVCVVTQFTAGDGEYYEAYPYAQTYAELPDGAFNVALNAFDVGFNSLRNAFNAYTLVGTAETMDVFMIRDVSLMGDDMPYRMYAYRLDNGVRMEYRGTDDKQYKSVVYTFDGTVDDTVFSIEGYTEDYDVM